MSRMAESLVGSLEEDDSLLDGLYNNGKQPSDLGGAFLSLQSSSMSRSDSKSMRRKSLIRPSLETEDLLSLLHGSDPVKVELNRLENEVRGKPFQRHHILHPPKIRFSASSSPFMIVRYWLPSLV